MSSERRRDPRLFLPTRLLAWGLAEILCLLGNLAPGGLAVRLWGWAVRLNPHQQVAATNRALALLERGDPGAGRAFETVLEQLENPRDTSASDLYLSRAAGNAARRIAARLLWGTSATPLHRQHDANLRQACVRLAADHFRRWLEAGDPPAASRCLAAWRSLAGDRLEVRWASAELAWRNGEPREVGALVEQGRFLSPIDTIRWAERSLDAGELDLARGSLGWARRFVPGIPRLWALLGSLAWRQGERREALASWERALALEPQDLETFFGRLEAERGEPVAEVAAGAVSLEIEVPEEIPLGGEAPLSCRLTDARGSGWTLVVLPPAGWGIVPRSPEIPFDDQGAAATVLDAHRPHRVRGEAWPLVLVALGPEGAVVQRRAVRVPDPEPGRVLVTVTEDHEIHEERGTLPPSMLRRLLVEKSAFAADLGVPWTHMVETGSVLAMPQAAEERGEEWRDLGAAIRRHLAEQVAAGHDLQPHLHAFNDPAYGHFPYRLEAAGWRPSLRFLLTAAERRGDWASACPPPSRQAAGDPPDGTFDRLASVERAVAQLEEVGRLGSPDYRAVLWRSGLLEYGDSAADRAWSAVALRRAGLLADSDLPKPGSPLHRAVRPAFAAGWEQPFTPHQAGGPLLQLPIVANVEGDYLMGRRLLARRAVASVGDLRRADGTVRPGVHLFTLLTHDKFFNARRGRDEFRLDPEYGDWPVVRHHLKAWKTAGATFVTAGCGVEAVVDDGAWRPVPRLGEETFLEPGAATRVRYRLRLLGRDIPVTESTPHHVLVPIPCSLRSRVTEVHVEQDGEALAPEVEEGGAAFWLRLSSKSPLFCTFSLSKPIDPRR